MAEPGMADVAKLEKHSCFRLRPGPVIPEVEPCAPGLSDAFITPSSSPPTTHSGLLSGPALRALGRALRNAPPSSDRWQAFPPVALACDLEYCTY